MIQNEREIRHELVLQAARRMMTAARTAPKGKGIDIIEIAMVTDGDILRLSDEMIQIAAETGFKFLLRGAENIKCRRRGDYRYLPESTRLELRPLWFRYLRGEAGLGSVRY